jgi:hypothetical protein
MRQPYEYDPSSLLPEPFLTAIGKVCVSFALMESIVELSISKLSDLDFLKNPKGTILLAHMSWPQRMDILSSLIGYLKDEYPRLNGWPEVQTLLRDAAEGRNRVVHARWAYLDGKVRILRLSARGKLKMSNDVVEVAEIEDVNMKCGTAAARLLKLIIGPVPIT